MPQDPGATRLHELERQVQDLRVELAETRDQLRRKERELAAARADERQRAEPAIDRLKTEISRLKDELEMVETPAGPEGLGKAGRRADIDAFNAGQLKIQIREAERLLDLLQSRVVDRADDQTQGRERRAPWQAD